MILAGVHGQMTGMVENASFDKTKIAIRLIDKVASVLLGAVRWAGLVGLAYYGQLSVRHLSGQDTAIFVSYLFENGGGLTITVSLSVGALGMIYGYRQRTLHQRAIAHFATRIAELERRLDPNRTSSGLTYRGETNPDDV